MSWEIRWLQTLQFFVLQQQPEKWRVKDGEGEREWVKAYASLPKRPVPGSAPAFHLLQPLFL